MSENDFIDLNNIDLIKWKKERDSIEANPNPFISVYPGNKTHVINLSRTLVNKLDLVIGQRIGFASHPQDKRIIFLYVIKFPTSQQKKDLSTYEIYKYDRNMFRIHSKDAIDKFMEAFSIRDRYITYRFYVHVDKPILKEIDGVETKFYFIFDIPVKRRDMSNEEKDTYNKEIMELYSKLFQ